MLLDVMTNEFTWRGHMAMTLQLPSFLGTSSIKRVILSTSFGIRFVEWVKKPPAYK